MTALLRLGRQPPKRRGVLLPAAGGELKLRQIDRFEVRMPEAVLFPRHLPIHTLLPLLLRGVPQRREGKSVCRAFHPSAGGTRSRRVVSVASDGVAVATPCLHGVSRTAGTAVPAGRKAGRVSSHGRSMRGHGRDPSPPCGLCRAIRRLGSRPSGFSEVAGILLFMANLTTMSPTFRCSLGKRGWRDGFLLTPGGRRLVFPVNPPANDRSGWPTRRCASFDDMRAYRIRQWQEAGCEARMKAAWDLARDYWVGMKGMKPDELRLQRSVAHLRRRGG